MPERVCVGLYNCVCVSVCAANQIKLSDSRVNEGRFTKVAARSLPFPFCKGYSRVTNTHTHMHTCAHVEEKSYINELQHETDEES